jgi:hypothetical protein
MIRQDQIGGTPFVTQLPASELKPGMWIQHNGTFKLLADYTYYEGGPVVTLTFDHGDYQVVVSYPSDQIMTVRY